MQLPGGHKHSCHNRVTQGINFFYLLLLGFFCSSAHDLPFSTDSSLTIISVPLTTADSTICYYEISPDNNETLIINSFSQLWKDVPIESVRPEELWSHTHTFDSP